MCVLHRRPPMAVAAAMASSAHNASVRPILILALDLGRCIRQSFEII